MRREYRNMRLRFPDFCGCELCESDVIVFCLNRIPPCYVASTAGNAVTEVALDKHQSRARLDVILMEAIRRVAMTPRCGAKATTLG